jgi:phosphate transport system permease protein
MTSLTAMLVAVPLGLFAAIYLSEYAKPIVRAALKPTLELLAGVPTVVYGYFALTFMTPLLRSLFGIEVVGIYNTASAGLVMGIMIHPHDDRVHQRGRAARRAFVAARGLLRPGGDPAGNCFKVVVPAALSGVIASFILGMSRAPLARR